MKLLTAGNRPIIRECSAALMSESGLLVEQVTKGEVNPVDCRGVRFNQIPSQSDLIDALRYNAHYLWTIGR